MANPDEPRRRFAPVPIETTFTSVRKTDGNGDLRIGPTAELTPDASPRSPSPAPREFPTHQPHQHQQQSQPRRRFAPQLIETSRRTRRVGDPGPATRPTDKTDITPYTKNIYTASTKSKARRNVGNNAVDTDEPRPMPPTRRETEEEAVKVYLLELAAKEAERQIQQTALEAAYPNSRAREGGVAHFYFRESSGSEDSPESSSPAEDDVPETRGRSRTRRKSSNLGLSWWHKHMQKHAQLLAKERGVDEMAVDDEEDVPKESAKEKESFGMFSDAELDDMDLSMPPDALWTTSGKVTPEGRQGSTADVRASRPRSAEDETMLDAPPPQQELGTKAPELAPASTANQSGLGRPFGAFGLKPDSSQLEALRKLASPPMLGKDLTFRTCPSPKLTKLEPNHPFLQHHDDLVHRDTSGAGGLWQGYCCKMDSNECHIFPSAYLNGPRLLATPYVPGTPAEPQDNGHLVDEPTSIFPNSPARHSRNTSKAGPSGLHLLHNLDQRLEAEKAQAERAEKIAHEFNDEFVTQVYNYLSLGYPATAHAFDDELSKISGTSVADLRSCDKGQMAKGHMLEMKLEDTPEEERCPRWKALRVYVVEWARQHPNLDDLDPLAWGVRERKGSWAF